MRLGQEIATILQHINSGDELDGLYVVPDWKLEPMAEKITKANNKGVKHFGEPVLKMTELHKLERRWLRTTVGTRGRDLGFVARDAPGFEPRQMIREHYTAVDVQGQGIKVEGFNFLASIEHHADPEDPGGHKNIVRSLDRTYDLALRWRTEGPCCDHCGTYRKRNDTFLVSEDATGNVLQVGRTCLGDFLGRDPTQIITVHRALQSVARGDYGFGAGPTDGSVDLWSYLPWVARSIRLDGWVSRGAGRASGRVPTADAASRDKWSGASPPTEIDWQTAEKAVAYILSDAFDKTSDYAHNVATAVGLDWIKPKHFGLVASVISAHWRYLADLERDAAPGKASNYVGRVRKACRASWPW